MKQYIYKWFDKVEGKGLLLYKEIDNIFLLEIIPNCIKNYDIAGLLFELNIENNNMNKMSHIYDFFEKEIVTDEFINANPYYCNDDIIPPDDFFLIAKEYTRDINLDVILEVE